MKKIIGIAITILLAKALALNAQSIEFPSEQNTKEANTKATGNYKDVFNSFFQLALDKITSDQKEVSFTSNPYAMMAELNPKLFVDTNYFRYRHLRSLNISFAGKLDEKYKFNGFSSNIKYALINKRDETISKAFVFDALNNPIAIELTTLNSSLFAFLSTVADNETKSEYSNELDEFRKGKKSYSELNSALQTQMKKIIETNNLNKLKYAIENDNEFSTKAIAAEIYDSVKKSYNNKLLWTLGIADTTYNDQFMFSNIVLSTQVLKGVVNPEASHNLELNLLSTLQFTDDSLRIGRDLSQAVWNIEPGLNFVLKEKRSGTSFLEFKLSGAYTHNFSKSVLSKDRDNMNINGTLRLRIMKDVWIPFEVRYDPKSGNVLGFLNVRANFSALTDLLKR